MYDPYLEHHGVKGMHWGVRKDEHTGPQSTGVPEITAHAARHNELVARYKKHGPNALSNDDLKFLATRAKSIAQAEQNIPKSWSEKQVKAVSKSTLKTIGRVAEVAAGAAFTAFVFSTLGKDHTPGTGSLIPSNNEIAKIAGQHGKEFGTHAREWLLS